MIRRVLLWSIFVWAFTGCRREEDERPLQLLQAFAGNTALDLSGATVEGVPADRSITLVFSAPVDQSSARGAIQLQNDGQVTLVDISFLSNGRTVALYPEGLLRNNTVYTLHINGALRGAAGERFSQVTLSFKTTLADMVVVAATIGEKDVTALNRVTEVPLDLSLTLQFSVPVNTATFSDVVDVTGPEVPDLSFTFDEGNTMVTITTASPLRHLSKYAFTLSQELEGAEGEPFEGISKTLYTAADPTPKHPVISDEALLTLVQEKTFSYFWDFAHAESGMARERDSSGDVVTTGGSGFGILALIVGVHRNFISRAEAVGRMEKILTFLEGADRFHGVWPHWLNGTTGKVQPFSVNDNGGDLVETSFLMQGLLTFRQFLDANVAAEGALIDRINQLWETVEWDWYTRGEQVLYWHWSPDKGWIMNHPIRGYNEALITYFLAAASPTHAIDATVYHEGWALNGAIVNNKTFYGFTLPLGYDYGGPLFFAHYSFLALDPRNLEDRYASYWTQNVNHSLINHAHAVENPKDFVGYSAENWGFTASDNQGGYSAHSPTNDLGVIAPTAALSSFPYTPEESMKALRFFYYTLGDRLWGPYGFYDAFNITEGWTASSYLAIDQGPIIVMIENYRSNLLWDLFMSAPEVQVAMDKLGFSR